MFQLVVTGKFVNTFSSPFAFVQ